MEIPKISHPSTSNFDQIEAPGKSPGKKTEKSDRFFQVFPEPREVSKDALNILLEIEIGKCLAEDLKDLLK